MPGSEDGYAVLGQPALRICWMLRRRMINGTRRRPHPYAWPGLSLHNVDHGISRMRAFRTFTLWPILLAFVLVTGCATVSQLDATNTALTLPQEGDARIVFYRTFSLFGYVQQSDILLDGKKVGRSAPGTQFHVDTSPGAHRIAVPNFLYSGQREIDVTVSNKEIIYVRTWIGGSGFGGRTNIVIVPPSQGVQETAGLEFLIE